MSEKQNSDLQGVSKPKVEDLPFDFLTDEEQTYFNGLKTKIQNARTLNNQVYTEFGGMTRQQYYNANEKAANTILPAKNNDDDVIVSSGTIETKLDSLLSHINTLNLGSELIAFDENNQRLNDLATALNDIIKDSKKREYYSDNAGDLEKKLLRQRGLLKQGTVFVKEEWLRIFEMKKKLKKDYDGKFKDFEVDKKLVNVFNGPSKEILYSPNVYLGDITKFSMDEQPFVYYIRKLDYSVASGEFSKFENWKYVKPGSVKPNTEDEQNTLYDKNWRFVDLQKNQVWVVYYEDKPNDEFNIIINGIPMLPAGFPLSAVAPRGDYNIVKQIFRTIHDKFAFGASFVSAGSIQKVSDVIDEMLKLFIMKTRKSITPAYLNISGRVIPKKILSPGRITMGVSPGDLVPVNSNETQGVTAGEFNFLNKMSEILDKNTVSQQFTGQQGKSGTTATEVLELKQQAQLTLGLAVASCAFLELKLDYKRLYNILENWFEPIGNSVMTVAGSRKLVKDYRSIVSETNIDNQGIGERSVVAVEDIPDPKEIRRQELAAEKAKGFPVRQIFLNSKLLKDAKVFWYLEPGPQEADDSLTSKLKFRELLGDVVALMNLGSQPNLEGLEDQLSNVHKTSKGKLFQKKLSNNNIAGAVDNIQSSTRGRAAESGVPELPQQVPA
jgi:hypothetical protein